MNSLMIWATVNIWGILCMNFKNLFSENEEKFSNKCLQIVSQFCSDLEVLSIGGSKVDINGLVLIGKLKMLYIYQTYNRNISE